MMSTKAAFIDFQEALNEAILTGNTANIRMLAGYLADSEPEYAEELIQKANKIEDDEDWAYDRWVDNNLSEN